MIRVVPLEMRMRERLLLQLLEFVNREFLQVFSTTLGCYAASFYRAKPINMLGI